MSVPTAFSDLSTTAASNQPVGSVDAASTIDDQLRQVYAFIRSLYEGSTNGQIAFPATQNASSDANTLDDYEEGTWTPAISFGGATTGITYTTQAGRYIKIGKKVYASAYVVLSSKGSATGNALLTGLPFTSVNADGAGGGSASYYSTLLNLDYGLVANVVKNTTTATIRTQGTAGATQLTQANFANTSEFQIELVYEASA